MEYNDDADEEEEDAEEEGDFYDDDDDSFKFVYHVNRILFAKAFRQLKTYFLASNCNKYVILKDINVN